MSDWELNLGTANPFLKFLKIKAEPCASLLQKRMTSFYIFCKPIVHCEMCNCKILTTSEIQAVKYIFSTAYWLAPNRNGCCIIPLHKHLAHLNFKIHYCPYRPIISCHIALNCNISKLFMLCWYLIWCIRAKDHYDILTTYSTRSSYYKTQ